MPIDWNWIKQRPQFLALGLAESGFDIHAIYLHQYRRKGLKKVNSEKVCLHPVYQVPPLGYRFSLINKINRWIILHRVAVEIKRCRPDIIWLTHPSQFSDIPDTFDGQIVYDCMDDYDVLGVTQASREKVRRQEQILCSRADLIFVSSSMLQRKICSRNPEKVGQVHLVRNGCIGQFYPRMSVSHEGKIYAGYVGTIAEWFDFELIMESLKRLPNLEYFLIGPVFANSPPFHERIHYLGTIAHDKLFEVVMDMDCMVMPFRLDEIVLSVDPVKLYEYISWQKNIIAVDYPEIHRFERFIQTYTNAEEYCTAIAQQKKMPVVSYSEEEVSEFLENNSWKNRVEYIRSLLFS